MPLDLAALLKPIPMTEDEKELRAWIKLNKERLTQCNCPQEAASLAIMGGFDPKLVYRLFSNFTDAMMGSQVESRARMATFNFNQAVDQVNEMKAKLAYVRELDLSHQWRAVTFYQTNDRHAVKGSLAMKSKKLPKCFDCGNSVGLLGKRVNPQHSEAQANVSKHTPTPWTLLELNPYIFSGSKNEEIAVARYDMPSIPLDQQKANAAYIVRVANHYEGMIELLRWIYKSQGVTNGNSEISARIEKAFNDAGEIL